MSDVAIKNGTRRATDRPTTRERILEAALDLFIERGVTGTTVSDIERAVGLAAGTGSFYRHFGSKEDPSVERRTARLTEEGGVERAALDAIQSPIDRRAREYELLLTEMRHFDPLWRMIVSERDRFPELRRIFTEALDVTHWNFGWDENPTAAVAVAALAGYHQFALLDAGPYRNIAPDDFIAVLVELTSRTTTTFPARKR
jgi:AcrR family transcriptional regulator